MGCGVSRDTHQQTVAQMNDLEKILGLMKKDVLRLEDDNKKQRADFTAKHYQDKRQMAALEAKIGSTTRGPREDRGYGVEGGEALPRAVAKAPMTEAEAEAADLEGAPAEPNDPEDDLIGEEDRAPEQQFAAVKPWKGAVVEPSQPPIIDLSPPERSLQLQWAHGYKCKDAYSNLVYNSKGCMVYPVASLIVTYDSAAHTQQHHLCQAEILCLAQNPANPDIVAIGQTASKASQPQICIYNTVTKEEWRIVTEHSRFVGALAFSCDGQHLAASGGDDKRSIAVYDWQNTRQLGRAVPSTASQVIALEWSRTDPTAFVAVGVRHVSFWSFAELSLQRPRKVAVGNQTFYSLCFSEKGYACIGASDGQLYVYIDGRLRKEFSGIHPGPSAYIVATLACDGGVLTGASDGTVALLDSRLKTKKLLRFTGAVISLACKGEQLLVGTSAGKIYEIPKYREGPEGAAAALEPTLQGHHDGQLWGMSVDPSGSSEYATAGEDNLLCIWDLHTHRLLRSTAINRKAGVKPANNRAATMTTYPPNQCARSVDYSPDGSHIAIGTNAGECTIFDAATLTLVRCIDLNRYGKRKVFNQKLNWIEMLKYSPSGRTLAVATHGVVVVLLNVLSGYKPKHKLTTHAAAVTCMDWSKESDHLQTVCMGYELLFHSIKEGDEMKQSCQNPSAKRVKDTAWATQSCKLGWWVDGIYTRLDGTEIHDGSEINSVDASHSRDLCVCGDDDGHVNMFRFPVRKGSQLAQASGHSSHVTRVKFSADDKCVLSTGGHDRSILVWSVNT